MSKHKPIFDVPRPAVFAHRGGAAEVPESTIAAFLHGLCHGADIIEVDINLSRDGVPVVWHGPELDITDHKDGISMKDNYVSCWEFDNLRSKLLVRQPEVICKDKNRETYESCPELGKDRRIMSLRQLVQFINDVKNGVFGPELSKRPIHLNIELKKTEVEGTCKCVSSWTQDKVANKEDEYPYLHKVLDILAEAHKDVTVVVGSVDHHILTCFREIQKGKYKTNLSLYELLAYAGLFEPKYIKVIGKLGPIPKNYAHSHWLAGPAFLQEKGKSFRICLRNAVVSRHRRARARSTRP